MTDLRYDHEPAQNLSCAQDNLFLKLLYDGRGLKLVIVDEYGNKISGGNVLSVTDDGYIVLHTSITHRQRIIRLSKNHRQPILQKDAGSVEEVILSPPKQRADEEEGKRMQRSYYMERMVGDGMEEGILDESDAPDDASIEIVRREELEDGATQFDMATGAPMPGQFTDEVQARLHERLLLHRQEFNRALARSRDQDGVAFRWPDGLPRWTEDPGTTTESGDE